jgi:hypothetical protein
MIRDTGSPRADAESDFLRARRLQVIAAVTARLLRKESGDRKALSFQEVVDALGLVDEVSLGVQVIPVEQIVGSVDRVREFDPKFRPRTGLSRKRFERIDEAARRGEPLPPIDVYRIGDIYFVRDGHHRVSVARALGETTIEAYVREVKTKTRATPELRLSDLPLKRHERAFHERVPLPVAERRRVVLHDEWRYARLADLVEAWGFRASHAEGRLLSREDTALRWFREDYEPVVEDLADAGLGGAGTETERYLRVVMLRYLLLHTHEWTDEVLDRLFHDERLEDTSDADTMVHMIVKELD